MSDVSNPWKRLGFFVVRKFWCSVPWSTLQKLNLNAMFNITDHCPHLITMETSLLTSSLSLFCPWGWPPWDGMKKRPWNKALVSSRLSYKT